MPANEHSMHSMHITNGHSTAWGVDTGCDHHDLHDYMAVLHRGVGVVIVIKRDSAPFTKRGHTLAPLVNICRGRCRFLHRGSEAQRSISVMVCTNSTVIAAYRTAPFRTACSMLPEGMLLGSVHTRGCRKHTQETYAGIQAAENNTAVTLCPASTAWAPCCTGPA
mmetsp:Transcript_4555/g.7776  ORF Transcript_4555/g.7776 Transcript_4555/m.7776 type:complete len:165 (+) Transcript_4555:968-1462(+)